MAMYIERPPLKSSHDLYQGDLVKGLIRPKMPSGKNLSFVRNKNKLEWPVKPEALSATTLDADLRVMSQVERIPLALVVSNSCDNEGEFPLLFVPVRDFTFSGEAKSDVERWLDISEAATGTASPKFFYLPADARFDLKRSEAMLTSFIVLSHDYVQRCMTEAAMTRVCGMEDEHQAHLQWSLSLMFGRHPREDDAWPSEEDMRLKLAWLEDEIPRSGSRKSKLEDERARLKKRLGIE